MSSDYNGLSGDVDDLVGEDSILGGSILSEKQRRASSKGPSKLTSKSPSKEVSDLGADDSFFGSGSGKASREGSKAASKADSFGLSNDALRTPLKPNPSTGAASLSQAPSSRPSTAGGRSRPASRLGTTPSDDFADLLGPNAETSSASLPRAPPSASGSGFGAAGTFIRPPSVLASSRPSTAMSRPESLGGVGGGSVVGLGSRDGSTTFGTILPSPELSASPRVSYTAPTTTHFTGDAAAAAGGQGTGWPRSLPRNDKSRLPGVERHIPTPFQLFRLYDADLNGRVTQEEFFSMLRDLDGHPLHYAPQSDPEHRLVKLREKRQRLESQRAAREEKLSLAEMHRQASEDMKREIAEEVAKMAKEVAELDARIAEEEAEVRQLVHHPDESQCVTPELRQHRAQWRSWVQDEFKRADLGGNGILNIDEFYMYFYSKLCFRFPVTRTGVNPGALLFNVFVRYCSIGRGAIGGRNEDMLSHQFAKLCRDAGLINGKTLTKAHVDIVYHRARAADESLETYKHKAGVAATARMYYPQFLFALDKIAEKRRSGFQEVVARVLSAIDTLPEPTFADFLVISGSELEPGAQVPEFLTRHSLLPDNSKELRMLADNDMMRRMKEESQDALNLTLGLAPKRDTHDGLKSFLESERAGSGGANTPQPNDTASPVAAVADSRVSAADGAEGNGSDSRAPALQASIYGSLPPPELDGEALRQRKWERPEPSELQTARAAAASRGVAPVLSPMTMHLVRGMDPDQLMASLKRVYEAYASWGGGVDRTALDRRRFSKVLRDALLISESGQLPTRKAEAVYDKVLPASARALNFIQFIEALRHVALHHRLSLNEVMEKLVAVGSPRPGP